jgi:hypothetical protein
MCAPSIKAAKNMRAKQLAMRFISITANPNLDNVTLKDFAKSNKISQNKLREQLKFLTGESVVNYNKNSNNIKKYNNIGNKHIANTSQTIVNTSQTVGNTSQPKRGRSKQKAGSVTSPNQVTEITDEDEKEFSRTFNNTIENLKQS